MLTAEDWLDTLLNSLPKKYDLLLESYHSAKLAHRLHLGQIARHRVDSKVEEKTERTRGRGSSRGRGRAGGRIGDRVSEVAHNNCFRCGQADHWDRDCPKKSATSSTRAMTRTREFLEGIRRLAR